MSVNGLPSTGAVRVPALDQNRVDETGSPDAASSVSQAPPQPVPGSDSFKGLGATQQTDDAAALGNALADKHRHIIQLCGESLRIPRDQVPCCLNLN